MSVNNGKRVAVVMLGYAGQAGYVEGADRDQISFPSSGMLQVAEGAEIMVSETVRRVLSVGASPFLRGFRVLDLAK